MEHEALTGRVIGGAMRVHRTLGPGFLEAVYARALAWELRLAGLAVECERRLTVRYRGCDVGVFVPDVIVAESVILEIKAVERLVVAHEVQLVNYLTTTGLDIGLLLNFGARSLEVRRKFRLSGAREVPGQDLQDRQDSRPLSGAGDLAPRGAPNPVSPVNPVEGSSTERTISPSPPTSPPRPACPP